MKEIVSFNLGQCGIQLAGQFWDRLTEKIQGDSTNRNVNNFNYEIINRFFTQTNQSSTNDILEGCFARAVLVDTEIGVVNDLLNKKQANFIDKNNIITGTEATGNNWAIAHECYGPKYREALEDIIRGQVEDCDSLQCFNLSFSLSGGTGSGLGSYLLELLAKDYPKIKRLTHLVTQRNDASVATYNNVLCLEKLQKYSDLSVFYSNEAILEAKYRNLNDFSKVTQDDCKKYFGPINDSIHDFVMPMLTNLGHSNYISSHADALISNLLPYPGLKYCSVGVSSLEKNEAENGLTIDQIFWKAIQNNTILSPIVTTANHSLGMALFGVPNFSGREISRQATRLGFKNEMVSYNRTAVKLPLKRVFGEIEQCSGLAILDNNCGIYQFLDNLATNFKTLYSKKAFLHHFLQCVERNLFTESLENIMETSENYKSFDRNLFPSGNFLNGKNLSSIMNKVGGFCDVSDVNLNKRNNGVSLKNYVRNSKGMRLWAENPTNITMLNETGQNKLWWNLCAKPVV